MSVDLHGMCSLLSRIRFASFLVATFEKSTRILMDMRVLSY